MSITHQLHWANFIQLITPANKAVIQNTAQNQVPMKMEAYNWKGINCITQDMSDDEVQE